MTTSPRWRTALASAASAAVLVAAPLMGAGTSHAADYPHPPKPTHTHKPYPPKPKPTHGHYPPKPHKPHHHREPVHHKKPSHHEDYRRELAQTGNSSTKPVLAGVAAALVATGAGTTLVARRRRS